MALDDKFVTANISDETVSNWRPLKSINQRRQRKSLRRNSSRTILEMMKAMLSDILFGQDY